MVCRLSANELQPETKWLGFMPLACGGAYQCINSKQKTHVSTVETIMNVVLQTSLSTPHGCTSEKCVQLFFKYARAKKLRRLEHAYFDINRA